MPPPLPTPPAAAPSRALRLRRGLLSLLRGIGLAYVLLVAGLYFRQTDLIFPGHLRRGEHVAVETSPGATLVPLRTAAGDRIVALYGPALTEDGSPAAPDARHPTVLYFYGNGMTLADCLPLLDRFRRLGVTALIPEYAGYGESSGEAGERGCYATADAAYDYLLRNGTRPDQIVAAGWSLGGAVATDLASRRPVAGLATFSAFTSMTEMAQRQYPYVPVALLLRHRFDNRTKIGHVHCPVLLAHGTDDPLVPPEMAERLAAAAGGPVTRVSVPGAGHNDLFAVGGDTLMASFRQFIRRAAGSTQ
jgi:fermentation-respiration switch protein FrsA (DUF1100 family)